MGMPQTAVSLGESTSAPSPSVAPPITPMANLMSITETLPPGSPRNGSPPTGPQPPRTSSRGSQNSPSSGKLNLNLLMNYWQMMLKRCLMILQDRQVDDDHRARDMSQVQLSHQQKHNNRNQTIIQN